MKTKLLRRITACVLTFVISASFIISGVNNAVMAARTPPSCCASYTEVQSGVVPTWVGQKTVPSSLQNTLAMAGVTLRSSNTGIYRVGNTSNFMCVSASLSSPSSLSASGTVYECMGSSVYSGDISVLRGKTYSQIVYACYQSSNWVMAHIVLSKVINNDSTMYNQINSNSSTSSALTGFLSAIRNSSMSGKFYLFVPDNPSAQTLLSLTYTPTNKIASVTFNKVDSNGASINGATVSFTTTNNADVRELSVEGANNVVPITGGVQFVTNGRSVIISGLKPNGHYRFTETNAPLGYNLASPIDVICNSNGEVSSHTNSTVTMIDQPQAFDGELVFNKRDPNGNPVGGAIIELRVSQNNEVYNPTPLTASITGAASNIHWSENHDYIVFTTTTSMENQLVVTGLPAGARYYFREIYVPNGYVQSNDIEVTLDNTGAGSYTMIDNIEQQAPGYGDIRIMKDYSDDFAEDIRVVYFYAYYNHDVDDTAVPFNRGYRMSTSFTNSLGEVYGNTYTDHIIRGESFEKFRFSYYQPDTWIAAGYLLPSYDQNQVWWNMFNDPGIYSRYGGADRWRAFNNSNGSYCAFYDFGNTGHLTWLPYGVYTIVEVWSEAEFVSSGNNTQRLYQETLNTNGWREIDSFEYEGAIWHRYAIDIVIGEGSSSHGLLTGSGGNSSFEDYLNNPNTGAVWLYNDRYGATLDLEKITRDEDSLDDLSFELWTTGEYSSRVATGYIDGSTGVDNHYNITWNYTVRVQTGVNQVYDPVSSPGSSEPVFACNSVTRSRVSGLPVGTYELREYAFGDTSLEDYAVPSGWTLVTDSTGTYFSKTFEVSEQGAQNHQQINYEIRNEGDVITVYKVDEWTSEIISDYEGTDCIEVVLYEDINANGVIDDTDQLVATVADTDKDGIVEFRLDEIYDGNYPNSFLVVETVSPYGYYINSNPVAVDLTLNRTAQIIDRPYTSHVEISKVDADTTEFISGAHFEVYQDNDADGVYTSGIDSIARTFDGTDMVDAVITFDLDRNIYVSSELLPGNYVVVETGLPDGYYYVDSNGNPTQEPNSFAFTISKQSTDDLTLIVYSETVFNVRPDIHTTLTGNGGSQLITISPTIELTDTVSYSNLFIGQEYILEGRLIDKKTGESIKNSDGDEILSVVSFVPTSSSGVVEVTFVIDSSSLVLENGAIDLVCFENLISNGVSVIIHENIEDINQTVHIVVPPPVETPPSDVTVTPTVTPSATLTPGITVTPGPGREVSATPTPNVPGVPTTGEDADYMVWIGIILVSVGGICALLIINKEHLL